MTYFGSLLAITLILPGPLMGQSVIGSSGLGMRLEPLDAVQRALGGVGVTTRTPSVLPGNAVAALDILAPTITFTVQPHWGKYKIESEKGDFFATRFPVLGFAYPLGTDAVITLTAGSQFDQNWSVETRDSIQIGGEFVGLTDRFVSDGAVAVVEGGWARRWSPSFAAGATVGVYRGGLTRAFNRTFDGETVDSVAIESQIDPFAVGGRWSHSGPLASLNLSWDPSPVLQVGATLSWSGKIKVAPADGAVSVSREVSAPLELKVSTSAVLSPTLAVNVGATTSNWTNLGDPSLDAVGSGRVMSYGAGVEWEVTRFWAGGLPLRFGFRRSELPFRFLDNKVKENTISFGFSVVMVEALDLPLAAFDFAIEVGKRNSGNFKETFRRLTVSMRVGGQ